MDEPEALDRSGKLSFFYCTLISLVPVIGDYCLFTVRIRNRLKKLMAKRPQLDQLKTKGIIEGTVHICEVYM